MHRLRNIVPRRIPDLTRALDDGDAPPTTSLATAPAVVPCTTCPAAPLPLTRASATSRPPVLLLRTWPEALGTLRRPKGAAAAACPSAPAMPLAAMAAAWAAAKRSVRLLWLGAAPPSMRAPSNSEKRFSSRPSRWPEGATFTSYAGNSLEHIVASARGTREGSAT